MHCRFTGFVVVLSGRIIRSCIRGNSLPVSGASSCTGLGVWGPCRASPSPVVAGPVGAAAFRRPSRAVRLRAASRPPAAGARPPPGPLPVLDSCAAPGTSPDAMPHGELPSCALTSGTHASVFRPARSPRHDPDRTLSCVRFDAFVILVRCSGVHDRHCTQQIRFFFFSHKAIPADCHTTPARFILRP